MANHLLLRLAVCFSTASALAFSQASSDPPQKSTASLEGKVVSRTTGNPLKKTTVTLKAVDGGKSLSAESDDKGSFAFPTVLPGRYTLTGERGGYARQPYGARPNSSASSVVTLAAGQEMRDLVFKLVPNAVIAGRVLDEDGEPMANAAVVALRPAYPRGRKQYTEAASAQVGANGEYSLSVVPGRYLLATATVGSLVAGLQGTAAAQPLSDRQETTYTTTFYPRSPDETSATPVDAGPGVELRGMDFFLTRVKAYRVRGKVTRSGPNTQLLAVLTQRGSATSLAPKAARVQADGSLEFAGVTPGPWVLRVVGEDGAAFQFVTVVDKHVTGLNIALDTLPPLTGSIAVEGKDPVPLRGIQVALEPMEGTGGGEQGTAGDEGKFTVKLMALDRYRVSLFNTPAGAYPKSVRYGNQDAIDEGADLTSGIAGSLQVVLAADGAEVSGVVTDASGAPVSGSTVALIPKSRALRLFKSDTTDQAGAFRLQSVPPGDYKLLAWEDVVSGSWFDEEFLKNVESKAEAVTVGPSEHKSVTLKAIPAEAKR